MDGQIQWDPNFSSGLLECEMPPKYLLTKEETEEDEKQKKPLHLIMVTPSHASHSYVEKRKGERTLSSLGRTKN